jgi:hypothetical protein
VPLEDRNDYLDVEGKMVHKASVVRGIFHRGIMSTDRLQRVRGFGRFQAGQGQAIDRAAQEVLMLSDLVACLVQLPGNKGKTVAVCMVEALPNHSKPLPVSELGAAGIFVSAKILSLSQPDPKDPSASSDLVWDLRKHQSLWIPGTHLVPAAFELTSYGAEASYIVPAETLTGVQLKRCEGPNLEPGADQECSKH